MHRQPILVLLPTRQILTTMNRDRHHVGSAVGQPDSGAGETDLERVSSEVTSRVVHRLICRSDVHGRRVVISTEMSTTHQTLPGIDESANTCSTVLVDHHLRCLDHQLHRDRPNTELLAETV